MSNSSEQTLRRQFLQSAPITHTVSLSFSYAHTMSTLSQTHTHTRSCCNHTRSSVLVLGHWANQTFCLHCYFCTTLAAKAQITSITTLNRERGEEGGWTECKRGLFVTDTERVRAKDRYGGRRKIMFFFCFFPQNSLLKVNETSTDCNTQITRWRL